MLRIFFILLVGIIASAFRVDPLVNTKLGLVRGLQAGNGNYSMYLGVPYGLVDEANPFSTSIPHPGFNGTFDASDDSIECPQIVKRGTPPVGKIQCLNLNIYVPDSANSQNLLPVMVWIHGGAFVRGDGNRRYYGPAFLMKHDVIVVSINYRLGIYGFMCTDSPKAPGNAGLKDQLLALRWINQNIASFGGDANKITLFGQSSGGMSVHLHLLSSHERLFDKAIIQSGSSNSPWIVGEPDNVSPVRIAEKLGFVTQDVDLAIDFLSRANTDVIVATSNYLNVSAFDLFNKPLTKPCVEKVFDGVERFIISHSNVASSNKVMTTPVMIGINSEEMLFMYGAVPPVFFNGFSFKDIIEGGFDVNNFDEMIDSVRHFYIGDEQTGENQINSITSFASDFYVNHPTDKAIELFLNDNARVVYRYVFSYEGGRNFVKLALNTSIPGVAHADELAYLFDFDSTYPPTENDQLVIDRMTTLWTNFAKYGDPTPVTSNLLPVKWEPVTKKIQPYLNIDNELTRRSRPFHDRMAFWDLFYELNLKSAKGLRKDKQ